MADLNSSLASAVRDGFCRGLPGVVTGALLFSALSAPTVGAAAVGVGVAAGAAAIYGLGCNRPLPDGAYPAPPFTGGQCQINYTVNFTFEYLFSNVNGVKTYQTVNDAIGNVPGPISGIRAVNAANGTTFRVFIDCRTGALQVAGGTGPVNSQEARNARITSVTPTNPAQQDNCGSLPPQLPPQPNAGNTTVNRNVTYTNNDGVDVTIPVVIAYGYANVDVNGELNIPVAIQANLNPVVNFNGSLNLRTGDLNVNIGDPDSPFGSNGPCGGDPVVDPDSPDTPLPLPPSDPVPPSNAAKPQKRRILRGCQVVTTVLNGRQTELDQANNPDIFVPAIGYINFLVQVGGKTAWTTDIAIKNVNQIVECPWIGGAIDVRGTPSYNNQFTIIPIYTQQTYPAQFPPES